MAAQAGLCLALSESPEDTFCRVVAHLNFFQYVSSLTDKTVIYKVDLIKHWMMTAARWHHILKLSQNEKVQLDKANEIIGPLYILL